MKNKINYFSTPQLRRQRGNLYVNFMTNLITPKVFKQIKKITKDEKRHLRVQ